MYNSIIQHLTQSQISVTTFDPLYPFLLPSPLVNTKQLSVSTSFCLFCSFTFTFLSHVSKIIWFSAFSLISFRMIISSSIHIVASGHYFGYRFKNKIKRDHVFLFFSQMHWYSISQTTLKIRNANFSLCDLIKNKIFKMKNKTHNVKDF